MFPHNFFLNKWYICDRGAIRDAKWRTYLRRDGVVHGLRRLVHHAQQILVDPAGFVQVVRLLEHLAEPPGAEELMVDTPAFHGVGQQRVAEPERRGAERGRYRYVRIRVVVVREPLRRRFQTVLLHCIPAQELRQKLVVGNVLDHRTDDSPRFLCGAVVKS